MKRNILLLLAGMFICQYLSAQVVFNFGPELGVGISSLPKSTSSTATNITSLKEKTDPLFGPLVGIYGQMIINKILLFNTGLQYEISGHDATQKMKQVLFRQIFHLLELLNNIKPFRNYASHYLWV